MAGFLRIRFWIVLSGRNGVDKAVDGCTKGFAVHDNRNTDGVHMIPTLVQDNTYHHVSDIKSHDNCNVARYHLFFHFVSSTANAWFIDWLNTISITWFCNDVVVERPVKIDGEIGLTFHWGGNTATCKLTYHVLLFILLSDAL